MSSIFMLNDDCLLQVFSYCSVVDLMNLEKVCVKFCEISQYSYKFYREFVWRKVKGRDFEGIISRIGPYLREITYYGMGNSDQECFQIVSKHCHRLRSLKLFQVSISMSLVYQIVELLYGLESLEMQEYLTYSEHVVSNLSCLVLCCDNLRKLCIGHPLNIYGAHIHHDYLIALTTVQELSLNLIGDGFHNISQCFTTNSVLKRVHLVLPDSDYEIYNEFCDALMHLTSLEELKLENLKNKSFESLFGTISELLKLGNLQSVYLKCCKDTTITTRAQRAMSRMRNLPHLTLDSLKNLSFDFLLQHIWLKTLQTFTVINSPGFTEDTLSLILLRGVKLEKIVVMGCPKIRRESLNMWNSIELGRESRKGIIKLVRENTQMPFKLL
ncbi:hypothetical protein DMENIID0001_052070 [Sergentomyia squamirostris]